MAEAQPRVVVALVNDLFFSVKLSNEIRGAGYTPRVVKTPDQFREALGEAGVALGVLDLSAGIAPETLLSLVDAARASGVRLIGFGPHKAVDVLRAAQHAGLDRVLSNSLFHAQTADLIRRYAAPETSEGGG